MKENASTKLLNKDIYVVLLLFVMLPNIVSADALVTRIKGESYIVLSDGYPLTISEPSMLRPGDKVTITKDDTKVHISQEGENITLDKFNTPYIIPEPISNSIFKNSWKVALSRIQEVLRNEYSESQLISRGTGKPIKLLGLNDGVNNLPTSLQMIRLFIEGGDAPLLVTMENEHSNKVFVAEISGEFVGIPTKDLAEGEYTLSIKSIGTENNVIVTNIQIVSSEEHPDNIKEVFAVLDSPAREQLTAILLAEDAKWRFAALQYAYSTGQLELVSAIINKQ